MSLNQMSSVMYRRIVMQGRTLAASARRVCISASATQAQPHYHSHILHTPMHTQTHTQTHTQSQIQSQIQRPTQTHTVTCMSSASTSTMLNTSVECRRTAAVFESQAELCAVPKRKTSVHKRKLRRSM
jgi:hypothetical protein